MKHLATMALALALAGAGYGLAAPRPLHVEGPNIKDDRGNAVLLRGVNCAALEWSSDGEGHIVQTVKTAIEGWKSNHVRIPLSQDRWFGRAPEQTDKGVAYRAIVKQIVDYCSAKNAYVMLDLHWSNAGEKGKNIGQHNMPDEGSLEFWKDVAALYANNPAVLFDLYNEPHDITWDVWLKGGTVTERTREGTELTYQAPGMQSMLDAVRSTGAKNVVVAGGLDWSYDLSGFLRGYALKDPKGNGVVYANHFYPFKGDTVDQWVAKMKLATATIPVIVSEFGNQNRPEEAGKANSWVLDVLKALTAQRWNWTAWDLHPGASPCLISGWDYEPTPSFGVPVKAALAK